MKIGDFEAKNTLGSLLDRVKKVEDVVIMRQGKRIARLVPNTGRIDTVQARAAVERIQARAKSVKSEFDWETLKRDRDEGRP